MKKALFILSVFICLVSCGNGSRSLNSVSNEDTRPESINREVLNVKLGDNRKEAIDVLTEQGFQVSERGTGNYTYVDIENGVNYSGIHFDKLSLMIYEAKIKDITLFNYFDSDNEAKDFFSKLTVLLGQNMLVSKQNSL